MKRKTRLEKTEEAFTKALQLIYEKKESKAYNFIYSDLSVDIFDYGIELLDNKSNDKNIIECKKICKKVFDALEGYVSDEEKELIEDNESDNLENQIIEDSIIDIKKNTLSSDEFADWFADYSLSKNDIIENFTDLF